MAHTWFYYTVVSLVLAVIYCQAEQLEKWPETYENDVLTIRIPYKIIHSYDEAVQEHVKRFVAAFDQNTCIRYTPWIDEERYINITETSKTLEADPALPDQAEWDLINCVYCKKEEGCEEPPESKVD